jgi:very-short-patch-repair endonuclease
VLPTSEVGLRESHRLSGVACLRTAAASYEWSLTTQPACPQLLSAAERLPSRGRDAAAAVAWRADGRAANPFESVVRAGSYSAAGIRLVPQRRLRVGGATIRPDLVDEQLRIVVECDSAEFHTSGRAIDKDCWRYTELALDGWLLVRVSWVQAMYRQPWVRSAMLRATDRQELALGTSLARARRFARGRRPGP